MRAATRAGVWHEGLLGSASLVRVGERLFTAGLMARDRVSLESEAHQTFQRAAALLHGAGAAPGDVLRTRIYYVDEGGERLLRRVHRVMFDDPGPAMTMARVAALPRGARVALEIEAARGAAAEIVHHDPVPAWGASTAVKWNREVFVAGLTTEDSAGNVAHAGDHRAQMSAVVERVAAAARALGADPADVVATRHYYSYAQRDDESPVQEKAAFMAAGEPTSAGICVAGVGRPDASFLFEAEAVEGAAATRRNIRTGRTFEVERHYSRAVRVGDVVYVAGTTSIVPGEVVRHPGEVRGQVLDTLETIRWAIEQAGLRWDDLVRTRSYVVGGQLELEEAAAAIKEIAGDLDAVATLTGVPILGRPEVVVEIEATAIV